MKAFALLDADSRAALVDVPDPDLASDGVRIRVTAASVNGFDVFEATGNLVRMMEHRFPTVVGRDFSGVVDAVGEGWEDVEVGDEVFGFITSQPPLEGGTFAEIVSEGPRLVLAGKPAAVSFIEAAAIPLAGSTALDSVDAIRPGPGDSVLIVGATGGVGGLAGPRGAPGGVGVFAVQLAAQRGATVIATAKAGDEEALVRSLGATDTVDYANADL